MMKNFQPNCLQAIVIGLLIEALIAAIWIGLAHV